MRIFWKDRSWHGYIRIGQIKTSMLEDDMFWKQCVLQETVDVTNLALRVGRNNSDTFLASTSFSILFPFSEDLHLVLKMERVIWSCLVDDDVFLDNYDFMQLLNVDRRRMQWLHGSFTWHSWRRVLAQWRRLREQRALAAQQRVNASGVQHRTWQDDPYLSDSS